MTANTQKLPLSRSFGFAHKAREDEHHQRLPKSLPVSIVANNGTSVTVNYEVQDPILQLGTADIAVAQSKYVRLPIQAQDKGYTVPADFYLGGVSNLGGGVADLTQRGNLATQVYTPINDANWPAMIDKDALELSGKHGVIAHIDGDSTKIINLGTASIVINFGSAAGLTIDGSHVAMHVGSVTATLDSSGFHIQGGNLTVNGTIVAVP